MTVTEQNLTSAGRRAALEIRDALVRSLRWEAEGVLSVELEPADGSALGDWEPGAHLDVILGNGLVRQYSLCSRPGEPWRVAVLREPASRGGSEFVHLQLRPGTVIGIRGPRNNFSLQQAPAYRFLAGGIGITPIIAMVRRAEAANADWTLDYLGRSRGTMAFLDELEGYGGRVRVHADDVDGLFDLSVHQRQPPAGTLAYACGPGGLLGALTGAAQAWDDPTALRIERFVSDRPAAEEPVAAGAGQSAGTPAAGDAGSFIVELADGAEVEVGPEHSILQALEERGYAPLNSCREGICGTCETTVLAGEVEHRDSLLSEEEKLASQTMMICVSRAAGMCPRLKLDLP
ncbi:PDR/VanB family oxidoreductase [Glutamicibacter creatinolyticus]|uniref:PDR/VanB family oxidoreductase n=1 Tax=Glutamicibacter creatinolyticus TaxID=162496 RepID=UPI0031E3D9E1